jgi:hypothetical protein
MIMMVREIKTGGFIARRRLIKGNRSGVPQVRSFWPPKQVSGAKRRLRHSVREEDKMDEVSVDSEMGCS